jgi:peptide/nickel transport system substrate-binding protein
MLKRVAVGLLLGLSLGGMPANAQEPKLGGVINAVIQPEPPGLMLALIQNGPTQMVSGNIYEGLLRYSKTLEPLPGLAESWTVSSDAKV